MLNEESFLITKKPFYKTKLKRYVEVITENKILFKKTLTYLDCKKIINILENKLLSMNIDLIQDSSIEKFIRKKELYIQKRSRLGLDIKSKEDKVLKKYNNYKEIVNLNMARPLRELQMWDSFFMATMKKSSNFSVPGSGKTASALGVFAFLKDKNKVKKIVMIGPKNSFMSWKDEFEISFGDKIPLNYFDIQDKSYKNKNQRISGLKYDTGKANLFLFNYESVKSYKSEIINIIDGKTLLIFDEVHRIKNPFGAQALASIDVSANAEYIITMTGTPIPNSYLDIYNLLHINYRDEYKDFFSFDLSTLKSPSENDIKNINYKLSPFFCRTSKDKLGVPMANNDVIIDVWLSKAENKIFNLIIKNYKNNTFMAFIRLLQLESNPENLLKKIDISEYRYILETDVENTDDIDYIDYSEEMVEEIKSIKVTSKIKGCLALVADLKKENKTIILWCIFIDTMELLKREFDKLGIRSLIINGKVNLSDRERELRNFKNGKYDVLISNPHTLAESISLHDICHDAIYLEYSYNLTHLLQSKDRIHRLGLPENQYTQYNFIISKGVYNGKEFSIDERIYNRLKEKERIMLEAINTNNLELGYSDEEDLNMIFCQLFGE